MQRPELPDLEQQRSRLHADLVRIGDFRRGSLCAVMRRCGKPYCACSEPAHPGHGPQHILTRSVAGRTVAVHLKPGPGLAKVAGELANYQRFRAIIGEIVAVNEAICEARPVSPLADAEAEAAIEAGAEKRGSSRTSRRSSPAR